MENIRHLECGSIKFVACAHTTDDGRTHVVTKFDEQKFACNCVDGVYNVVELGKIKLVGGLRIKTDATRIHLAIGVDIGNAITRHIHLALTNGRLQRVQLTIDVAWRKNVVIHQGDFANTSAGKSLHRVTSHTTNAENGNVAVV